MNRVAYEWIVEQVTVDEHGDIVDIHAVGSYAEARRVKPEEGCAVRICVVRDEFDSFGDLKLRLWAYPIPALNALPEHFEDSGRYQTGVRVPKRFHAEVARKTAKE